MKQSNFFDEGNLYVDLLKDEAKSKWKYPMKTFQLSIILFVSVIAVDIAETFLSHSRGNYLGVDNINNK